MIPEQLEKILVDLREEVWIQALLQKAEVFVVGGSVRDAYRGKSIKDIDIVVEGPNMDRIKDMLSNFGEVGIYGESFAVIKFKPKGYKGEPYDIAVPRVDRKIGEGHKGFEVISNEKISIEEDLRRRDLTINSFCVNIITNEIIDPFNGLSDMEEGILRATNPLAFAEDPLRILRTIGFASRFRFKIDPNTMKLMQNHADEIREISGERIFDELIKILNKDGDTQIAFDLLTESDVDVALFDKKMIHYGDGLDHLDKISFFYVLGIVGDVNPADFLKKRFKGDNILVKDVRALDNIFTLLPHMVEEEDLLFMLFKAFNHAPNIMDALILSEEVEEIVLKMRTLQIPHTWDDIKISGEDVMKFGRFKEGPEVGLYKETILRDALMNRFNWRQRGSCIEYLKKIFF